MILGILASARAGFGRVDTDYEQSVHRQNQRSNVSEVAGGGALEELVMITPSYAPLSI